MCQTGMQTRVLLLVVWYSDMRSTIVCSETRDLKLLKHVLETSGSCKSVTSEQTSIPLKNLNRVLVKTSVCTHPRSIRCKTVTENSNLFTTALCCVLTSVQTYGIKVFFVTCHRFETRSRIFAVRVKHFAWAETFNL